MKKIFLFAIVCAFAFAACNTEKASTSTTEVETVTPTASNEISAKQQQLAQAARAKQQQQKKAIQATSATTAVAATNSDFKWYTFEEAVAANEKEPKKFMIDMYTSWCGWCKVMDQKTFSKPEVQDYLNEHFYAIKFNAERKDKMSFKGEDFEFMQRGRRGIHGLANKLMNGRASYPTIVYLDEKMEPIRSAPGFKQVVQIMPELKYAAENAYKTQSLGEFQSSMR